MGKNGNGSTTPGWLKKVRKATGEAWESGRENANSGGLGPDKKNFRGQLTKVFLDDQGEKVILTFLFVIPEGEEDAGTQYRVRCDLTYCSDKGECWGIDRAQKTLARLGYEVGELDMEELPKIMKELNAGKPVCRLTAKTAGEYQNTYVNKVEDSEDDEDDTEDDDSGTEESEDSADDEESEDDSADDDNDEPDEDAEEETEDDSETPEKGDEVSWGKGKSKKTGIVNRVKKDEEAVVVEYKAGKKTMKVVLPLEEVTIL